MVHHVQFSSENLDYKPRSIEEEEEETYLNLTVLNLSIFF